MTGAEDHPGQLRDYRRALFETGWEGARQGLHLAARIENAASESPGSSWAYVAFGHNLYLAAQSSARKLRNRPQLPPGAFCRVQLSRKAGARVPANTVLVSRPSIFGNPFVVEEDGTAAECVALFRQLMIGIPHIGSKTTTTAQGTARSNIMRNLDRLKGRNLACWCSLDAPCHGDVLLVLAAGGVAALGRADAAPQRVADPRLEGTSCRHSIASLTIRGPFEGP